MNEECDVERVVLNNFDEVRRIIEESEWLSKAIIRDLWEVIEERCRAYVTKLDLIELLEALNVPSIRFKIPDYSMRCDPTGKVLEAQGWSIKEQDEYFMNFKKDDYELVLLCDEDGYIYEINVNKLNQQEGTEDVQGIEQN